MKKRILSIAVFVLLMVGLVGCTPAVSSYMEKTAEVQNWKGSDLKANAEVAIAITEEGKTEQVALKYDINGVTQGKDKAQIEMNMDISELKKFAETEEVNSLPNNIAIKMFIDKDKMYINKSIFELSVAGNKELLNSIKEEYVALPILDPAMGTRMSPDVITYLSSAEFNKDILNIMEKAFKGYKPVVELKVEGNKFTFEANSDQIIDEGINAILTLAMNWNGVSADILKVSNKFGAELTEAELKDAFKDFNKEEIVKSAEELKTAIKGSTIKSTINFEENKYTENNDITINIDKLANIKMHINSETTKNENAKVVLPKSFRTITMEEYMDLIAHVEMEPMIDVRVNGEALVFDDQLPVIEEGRTLVPFRVLLEKLGAKVEWDEAAKTVTATKDNKTVVLTIGSNKAMVDGKEVQLDVAAKIESGRTLVPLRFISETFDYKVKFDNEIEYYYLIDIYNTSDEELDKNIAKDSEIPFTDTEAALPEEGNKAETEATKPAENGYVYSTNPILNRLKAPAGN